MDDARSNSFFIVGNTNFRKVHEGLFSERTSRGYQIEHFCTRTIEWHECGSIVQQRKGRI